MAAPIRPCSTRLLGAVALLCSLTAAACGAGAAPTPSSTPSRTDKGSPPATRTTSPPKTYTLRSGQATLRITGDRTEVLALTELGPVALEAAPPGQIIASWHDAAGDGLSLQATSFVGTRETSPLVLVNLVLVNPTKLFHSASGGCSVRLSEVGPGGIAGTVTCARWEDDDSTIFVSVTVDFAAAP
jgi:hypothetical protein